MFRQFLITYEWLEKGKNICCSPHATWLSREHRTATCDSARLSEEQEFFLAFLCKCCSEIYRNKKVHKFFPSNVIPLDFSQALAITRSTNATDLSKVIVKLRSSAMWHLVILCTDSRVKGFAFQVFEVLVFTCMWSSDTSRNEQVPVHRNLALCVMEPNWCKDSGERWYPSGSSWKSST